MLTAAAEQLRTVDDCLPRRDRAELGDHPAGVRRLLVEGARLANGGAAAAERIAAGERIAGPRCIDRRRSAGLARSRRRSYRLALAGGARDRCSDQRPRADHAGRLAVPRAAADAMLSMPKL